VYGETAVRGVLLAVLVAALVVAPTADAVVVPQRSIAGIRLGMTQAQVKRVLGKPKQIQRGRNGFGRFVAFQYQNLRVFFQGTLRVTSISTTRRGERTQNGIGIGSTERAVRKKVRGVHCSGIPNLRLCEVGVAKPGRRLTTFFVRNGRVATISLALVVD
jgi:hypothetical protein